MSHLAIRYQYDGSPTHIFDDFGWLEFEVDAENCSGKGGYWVQWQDVKEFGEKLGTFPIDSEAPLSVYWGFQSEDVYIKILGLQIAPSDAHGNLTAHIQIVNKDRPSDRINTTSSTNYENVKSFQTDLFRLMSGDIAEAQLLGQ